MVSTTFVFFFSVLAALGHFIYNAVTSTYDLQANVATSNLVVLFVVLAAAFPVVGAGVRSLRTAYEFALKGKKPLWFYGFDPAAMAEYLTGYSLSSIEGAGHEEFLKRYIRPKGRDLTVMEIERTVLAEV